MAGGDAVKGADGESWLVRVLDEGGGVAVGTGFLISGSIVLTCAHVVSRAVGSAPGGGRPRDYVSLDLPAFQEQRQAEVLPGGWFPGGEPDLAVLALHGPSVRSEPPPIRGRAPGTAAWPDQWQMPAASWTGSVGYSGTPCLDLDGTEIIGMLTGGAPGSPELNSHLLPASVIVGHWPPAADPSALTVDTAARRSGAGLTIRQIGAVVEALFEFPGLRDERLRSLYIDLLAKRNGAALDLERYIDARRDLWSLARWCARVFGGFRELLEVLEDFHPASVEVYALTERLARVAPAPLLTYAERASLEAMVGEVSRRAVIESAETSAALRDVPADRSSGQSSMLGWLEDSVTSAGVTPPIVEFAAVLADSQAPELRAGLLDWVETVSLRLGTPSPAVATVLPTVGASVSYLIVRVAEDYYTPGRYSLTAWSQRQGQLMQVIQARDGDLPLDQVEPAVARLFKTAMATIPGGGDDLVIEFVLPESLLNLPVDQWRTGPEADARPVGIYYPVVVRSLEHRPDPSLRWRWAEHLPPLRGDAQVGSQDDAGVAPRAIVRVPSGDLVSRRRDWVEELRSIADGAVPFLDNADPPHLRAAVRAGVPVLLWSREPGSRPADARLLRTLGEGSLRDLPAKVMNLRREAAVSEASDHVGRHVTLLWDDPTRPVETGTLFTMPSASSSEEAV